jgi:hypothetical protein
MRVNISRRVSGKVGAVSGVVATKIEKVFEPVAMGRGCNERE